MPSLIPKDVKFLDLFAAAGANLAEASADLKDLVQNFDRLDQRIAGIQRLEKRGDQLDHEINVRLENAFVAPFDREDIHELTVRLDDVVDYIQAVGGEHGDLRRQDTDGRCPAARRDPGRPGHRSCSGALGKLEKMKDLTTHLEKIHELEHEADGVSRAAIGRLFRESHDPLEVIKWREIYLGLENAIDAAEDAAEAIERMIHKRV